MERRKVKTERGGIEGETWRAEKHALFGTHDATSVCYGYLLLYMIHLCCSIIT